MSGHAIGQIQSIVAHNINTAMLSKGLTAASVARDLDTHEKTVRRWRTGEVTPSRSNMQRLAILLNGGDVGWFYTEHADGEAA